VDASVDATAVDNAKGPNSAAAFACVLAPAKEIAAVNDGAFTDAKGNVCSEDIATVADAEDAAVVAAAAELESISIDACSANDAATAKGIAACSLEGSSIADTKDAGAAVEEFDRVWARSSVDVAAAVAGDVDAAASEGEDSSANAVPVDTPKGVNSAEDFAPFLAPRPVRMFFLFRPIVYTQCHRYRSSKYQFTVQVKIAFHKEDHRIHNRITSISLQSKSQ
jgi:hypothetical protein